MAKKRTTKIAQPAEWKDGDVEVLGDDWGPITLRRVHFPSQSATIDVYADDDATALSEGTAALANRPE